MKTNTETTTFDKLAMILGGGLILLGTLVMGVLETVIGNPSPVPLTNEAGDVIAATTFPVDVRAYVILLGLFVWFLFGVYKLIQGIGAVERESAATPEPAR